MNLNKEKSGVAIVIGGPRPSKSDDTETETESDEPMSASDDGLRAAVKDLFAAYDRKDIDAGVKALRAAIQCVDPNEESDDGEEYAESNKPASSKY